MLNSQVKQLRESCKDDGLKVDVIKDVSKNLSQYKDFDLSAIKTDVPHIEYLNVGDDIAAIAINSLHQ